MTTVQRSLRDPGTEDAPVVGHKTVRKSHGSVIMLLLTISITFCWVPSNAYYSVIAFKPEVYMQSIDVVTNNMLLLQSVFDPILFAIALKDVRDAVKRVLTGSQF